MTGPAKGKIALKGIVKIGTSDDLQSIKCDIYLHIKGYSLARVTHVDLEDPLLNEILPPKKSLYLPFKVRSSAIEVMFSSKIYVESLKKYINRLIIYCPILASVIGEGVRSRVYVGGKYGGMFLGFKKEYVDKLENLAIEMGVKPKTKR